LRDRKEDIPELAQYFFEHSKGRKDEENPKIPSSLLPYFQTYDWPGNVRELENTVARILALARGDEITPADLPAFLRWVPASAATEKVILPEEGLSLEAVERNVIVAALRKFGGNQSTAARYLSITRKVLMNRIAKYRIHKTETQGEAPLDLTSTLTVGGAKQLHKEGPSAKAADKGAR
jgi:two-component system NtrC family response regulator